MIAVFELNSFTRVQSQIRRTAREWLLAYDQAEVGGEHSYLLAVDLSKELSAQFFDNVGVRILCGWHKAIFPLHDLIRAVLDGGHLEPFFVSEKFRCRSHLPLSFQSTTIISRRSPSSATSR